jgi:peptidyl-prolyl cis-trans isomerase D
MLEQLRRNSRSFLIWLIFGVIIAAFVLFFGPQAGPDMLGCGASKDSAVVVDGSEVTPHSWRFAMNGLGFGSGGGPQAYARRHTAIDYLVERELLANAARQAGFRISDDLVNERIKSGVIYVMGHRQDASGAFFRDGVFEYELLQRTAHQLGLPSVAHFIEEQRREQLADAMRDLILASVQVSEEEALAAYIHENTTVSVEYVKFEVGEYAAAMKLGDADLRTFAAAHPEEIETRWTRDKARWEREQEWVLVRHVFVRKGDDDAEAEERARLLRARITSGEELAAVALEASEDERSRYRGGNIGWRPADSLGFGNELVEAARELEAGALSEVVATATGYHVFQIEKRHEGALSLEEKRLDLAAEIAPAFYGRERARLDAEAALAAAGETPLDELFERVVEPPRMPDLPPGMTQEDLDRIMRQLQEQGTDGGGPMFEFDPGGEGEGAFEDEGAFEGEGEGDQGMIFDDQAPSRAARLQGAGGAPRRSDLQVMRTWGGPGNAADGPRSRSWEGPNVLAQAGAEPVEVEAPEPARPEPGEAFPEASGVAKPGLKRLGPISRTEHLRELGRSRELVADLFDRLDTGKVAERVYRVEEPEGFVVVKLTDRRDADLEQFAEEKREVVHGMRLQRGLDVLYHWVEEKCRAAGQAGKIRVNRAYLVPDEDAAEGEFPYGACQNLSHGTVAGQLSTRAPQPSLGF